AVDFEVTADILCRRIREGVANENGIADVFSRDQSIAILDPQFAGDVSDLDVAKLVHNTLIAGQILDRDPAVPVVHMNSGMFRHLDGERAFESLARNPGAGSAVPAGGYPVSLPVIGDGECEVAFQAFRLCSVGGADRFLDVNNDLVRIGGTHLDVA